MSIKRVIKSILQLLFMCRGCKHRWIERNRKVYNFIWDASDPVPVERLVVIELRCARCGDIKITKYKV